VVLLPGILILLLTAQRRNTLNLLPGIGLAISVAATTPLGVLYLGRTGEAGAEGSSSSFRFVEPYLTLLPASLDTPFATLFGHGAASAEDYLLSLGTPEVTSPVIPKILYEYGLLGALGVMGVLLVLLSLPLTHRPWLVGLWATYFFINASLLQATLVFVTLFWLMLLPPRPQLSTWDARARYTRTIVPARSG
uniref:hypothetical protein n=1 Tax=Naasia sp. SYSU D00057 TaxID=2817380 RepID=UPI001B316B74